MKTKKIVLILFIAVVIAQLFVPAKMILNNEDILNTGKIYKFKTAPIDPSDPFRGKYINLNFEENRFNYKKENNWVRNEDIFVVINTNKDGFATITNVVKEKPLNNNVDFIEAKVQYIYTNENDTHITIKYPFDRFYMEESKAKNAEDAYREYLKDKNNITYALVAIKNGQTVLKDVFINEKNMKTIVEEIINENN
ncbi:GDYXXLXY domain-containing protein [uncultured Lutibacter sp.]|uniref:GDYXXLXY domain-containing protein n=1 Tax=uncultured Lutibacter sp. TaxID=437739 RepID=UPI002637F188|nr:GDYXXLXY domain-containing protein [uncultured Lutibacter sp.]